MSYRRTEKAGFEFFVMAIGQFLPMKSRIARNDISGFHVFTLGTGLSNPIYGVRVDRIAKDLYVFSL